MGSLEKTWEASRKGTPPVSSARLRDVRASLGNRGDSHGSPLIVGQRAFWG